MGCGLEMHLNEVFTGLSSGAINGIKELGVSFVLLSDRALEAINIQNCHNKYQIPDFDRNLRKIMSDGNKNKLFSGMS